jgi:branched-chain amino acid transport system permease protein
VTNLRNATVRRIAALALAAAAAAALPTYVQNESVQTTLVQALLIATLAVSWNILSGFAGQINLGHAAFFGVGALTARLLWLEQGLPFWISFLAGGLAAVLFALIVGAPALRLRGIYFAIGTLALAQALRVTVGNVLPIVTRLPGPALATYDISQRYYLALGVLLVTVLATILLSRSKLGLGMQAVREDEEAAQSIGVNTFAYKLTAFAMSAFFAGIAGSAFAFYHVSYYFDLPFEPIWTFDALLITFVGGIGTIAGPLIGTVFFVYVSDVLAAQWVDFHLILFGTLFILVVLALPGGFIEFWERIVKRLSAVRQRPANPTQGSLTG